MLCRFFHIEKLYFVNWKWFTNSSSQEIHYTSGPATEKTPTTKQNRTKQLLIKSYKLCSWTTLQSDAKRCKKLMKSCALDDAWDRDNNHGDDWTQQWETAQQWVATIAPPCDVNAILCTQQWRAVRMENRFSYVIYLFALFSVCIMVLMKNEVLI